MFCWRYRRLLMPYAECALDERTRARVEAHLAACPACAAELRLVTSVSAALRSEADVTVAEPAHDLWARVNERITSPEPVRPSPAWRGIPQAATVLASVALIAVVGFSLIRTGAPTDVKTVREAKSPSPVQMVPLAKSQPKKDTKPTPPPEAKEPKKPAPPERIEVPPQPTRPPARRWFAAAPKDQPKPVVLAAVPPAAGEAPASVAGPSAERGAKIDTPAEPAESHGLVDEADTKGVAPAAPTVSASAAGVTEKHYAMGSVGDESTSTHSLSFKGPSLFKAGRGTEDGDDGRISSARTALAYKPSTTPTPAEAIAYFDSSVANEAPNESVVDILNKTEGVSVVALFSYP